MYRCIDVWWKHGRKRFLPINPLISALDLTFRRLEFAVSHSHRVIRYLSQFEFFTLLFCSSRVRREYIYIYVDKNVDRAVVAIWEIVQRVRIVLRHVTSHASGSVTTYFAVPFRWNCWIVAERTFIFPLVSWFKKRVNPLPRVQLHRSFFSSRAWYAIAALRKRKELLDWVQNQTTQRAHITWLGPTTIKMHIKETRHGKRRRTRKVETTQRRREKVVAGVRTSEEVKPRVVPLFILICLSPRSCS